VVSLSLVSTQVRSAFFTIKVSCGYAVMSAVWCKSAAMSNFCLLCRQWILSFIKITVHVPLFIWMLLSVMYYY